MGNSLYCPYIPFHILLHSTSFYKLFLYEASNLSHRNQYSIQIFYQNSSLILTTLEHLPLDTQLFLYYILFTQYGTNLSTILNQLSPYINIHKAPCAFYTFLPITILPSALRFEQFSHLHVHHHMDLLREPFSHMHLNHLKVSPLPKQ